MKTITYDENLWKLVPVKPTYEMLAAFRDCNIPSGSYAFEDYNDQLDWEHGYDYTAMLAAAPQPPQAAPRGPMTDEQIDAPEPYDQQALELCDACGWKALIPGDCCLNCTRPNPDQEPHGWLIQGSSHMYRGEYAEIDSKSDAQRIGGTCHAYALYTKPQPAADLTDDEIKAIAEKCADDQWPDVGYVEWSVVDTEFYARLVKAVLAAQKGKTC